MTTDSPYRLELSARRVPRVLGCVVAVLLLSHLVAKTLHYRGITVPWDLHLVLDVDEEPTLPTWYSSMAILGCAVLARAIGRAAGRAGDRDAPYWNGLAAGLAFMSLDEIAALHEMMNTFVDIEWTIPGAIAAGVVSLLYLPFLRRLPRETARRFVLAGAVYLAGVLGVEHLTGPQFFRYSMDTLPYAYVSAFEEGLEMLGVVLLVRALLLHMAGGAGTVTVGLEVEPPREASPRP